MKMLNGYTLFFALQYAFQTSGKIQFTSDYKGKNVTGLVGASVAFIWSYSGGVKEVTWGIKKDSETKFITNGVLVSRNIQTGNPVPGITVPADYAGRVNASFSGNSSSGQAIFTLTSIRKNDQRFYGCQLDPIDTFDTTNFDSVYLIAQGPPDITDISPNHTVNEGDKVTLNCTADANPTARITWTRVSDNSIVTFPLIISKQDKGAYRCTANNGIGNPVSRDVFITVQYAVIVKNVTPLTTKSWFGQKVALRCVAEGVPTPTITWKKPSGVEINKVTALENTADVVLNNDQDFGQYTCTARNGIGAAATKTVEVQQIKAPNSPSITVNIQATSISVSWTTPADGGSPITAYRVVVLQGSTEIRNENITYLSSKTIDIGGLTKSTNYTVKVFARNFVFEGNATETKIQTNFEGIPAAAEIIDLPVETDKVNTTLKWKEALNNGASITEYTVYRRTINEDGTAQEWIKLNVNDPSDRKVVVTLQKGKVYEFVVTATNSFGEGAKEERKIKKITVLGGVPSAVAFTYDIKDDEIILKWKKPDDNGAAITLYTIYQRIENDEPWKKIGTITYTSKREYVVKVEKGKEYKFVVTATNKYGEYPKRDNIKKVKVPGGSTKPTESQTGSSCDDEKITLHAVYMTVIIFLLISNIVLISFLCRMRSRSEHLERSNRQCPRCGDLIAMNSITIKLEADTQPSSYATTVDGPTYAAPVSANYMPLHPSTRSWEVSRQQVSIIKVIGKGAFSQVAQATVRNIRGGKENTTVAAKMLKANAPASDKKDLLSELELMKKLKPHPHVIKLMGCVTESDPLLVLIEYVPYGDLLGYLRKSRGLNDTYFKDPDVKPQSSMTAEQLMKFAWQVADGMFYLSSKKIIHRDLAARNVLVGEGEKCKVTDFGMARNVQQDDIYNRTSRGRLPVKWTAYEALMYGTYTTQSDVWSFGVMLYEIFTVGGSPYPDINPREIARKLQKGYRMPKPRHVEDKLYQIMLRCWEENPVDRPTFDKLRKTIKEMEINHKTYVNLNQYDHSLYANVKDLTAE